MSSLFNRGPRNTFYFFNSFHKLELELVLKKKKFPRDVNTSAAISWGVTKHKVYKYVFKVLQGPPHESLWKWHLSSILIIKKIKDSIGPALWYKTDFFPYYKTIWKGFREIKIVKFNWRKTWNENVSKVFCQKCFFTQKSNLWF